MPRSPRIRRPGRERFCATALALAFAMVLAACTPARSGEPVAPVAQRPNLDLSTPDASVRTYLAYTSFAYRMANSDLASEAATPYEGVRIDSYIELNRQKGQGIEQQLVRFAKRGESKEGTRVVLAASEEWRYRYFGLQSLKYTSPQYEASYETTYTLVSDPRGWLVDKVEAKALTPVK